MWKFKHTWPFFITLMLFGLLWGMGLFNGYADIDFELRRMLKDVLRALAVLTLLWIPALAIISIAKHRFKGGMFWGFIIFFLASVGCFFLVIVEKVHEDTAILLFVVFTLTLNLLYTVRHFQKPRRYPTEVIKWLLILIAIGVIPLILLFLTETNSMPNFVRNEETGLTLLGLWNLLGFAVLFLNLRDLQRREEEKQQLSYEQMVEELGDG